MYELTVTRDFVAQHRLTVPDPGPEGRVHSHHFRVEVLLAGETLNEHGYLVDIDDVRQVLTDLEDYFRDSTLNTLPEFEGLNPSVERFAREFSRLFLERIDLPMVDRLAVTIWEDDAAGATYAQPV